MSASKISLIFSTFNGEKTLPRMLDSLKHLDLRGIDLRILAVDNGSTDRSHAILRSAVNYLPLTILSQPERGKNKGLNMALQGVGGDFVAFTDDDVVADAVWLRELVGAAESRPQFDIFGGRIVPDWPSPPALRIVAGVPCGAAFGISEADWETGPTHPSRVWGANMMVRSHIFEEGHRFSEEIGPAAGNYIMGSETEFNKRMAARGNRCFYVASALVAHMIRTHQLERKWLMGRAFRYGRGLCASESPDQRNATSVLFGVPRWQLRECLFHRTSEVLASIRGDKTSATRASWNFQVCRGYIEEWKSRRLASRV